MTLTAGISTSTSFDLGSARALSCRECGHETPLAAEFACPECFGPLEVAYDFGDVTRESIEQGPRTSGATGSCCPCPRPCRRSPTPSPASPG